MYSGSRCLRTGYLVASVLAPLVDAADIKGEYRYHCFNVLSRLTAGIIINNPDKDVDEVAEILREYYGD